MSKAKRVTVVFSDQHHVLKLVEARAEVKLVHGEDRDIYRVDKLAAEAYARSRLIEAGLHADSYDFVGILVAHEGILDKGRISWAEEVEVREAIVL